MRSIPEERIKQRRRQAQKDFMLKLGCSILIASSLINALYQLFSGQP